jgi:peptidoglycan hydrolase CwlO-like protein
VPRFSITVPDNLVQAYERVDDLEAEVEELRERLDSRADRIDQLEEQLARRSQVEEKVDILAERVEDRERAADAPFFVRWARWFRSDDG